MELHGAGTVQMDCIKVKVSDATRTVTTLKCNQKRERERKQGRKTSNE